MDRQAAAREESSSNTAPSTDRLGDRLSRRRLLAAGASVAVVGTAGCAQVANYIAGLVLEDVNLFNQTDRQLTGTISVTDPAAETVLDESFEIQPETDDEGEANGSEDGGEANESEGTVDEESGATYADVLTGAGEYTVSATLDDDSAIEGETTAERSVDVADPAAEHIVVVFGADDFDGVMGAFAIEEFTDIGEHVEN
ncbi:hypothetical protein [Halohasta litorea]|uniref:Tat (Twin-arginine translocation) pathway signal sequence n=1 Tax=Halohasta litorea TaxID=869891 RepID=A0ABD6DA66_9EURY|nr:hypothetical protein [Halohasta litorea]